MENNADGFWQGRTSRETVKEVVAQLFILGETARNQGEFMTAVMAYDRIGNLVLKCAKLWPDKPTAPSPDEALSAQRELMELMDKVLNRPPNPVNWEV
jgi:hypothetical protein